MSLIQIPGQIGYEAYRAASMDGRALGKFTDTNHLSSIHSSAPAEYDKKIISIYTQSSLYNNDFMQMLNQSTPWTPRGNTDSWYWKINVPYNFPRIIGIPATTAALQKPGIDNQPFQIIVDRKEFYATDVITCDRRYAPDWYVIDDPTPFPGGGWLYTLSLNTTAPLTDFVASRWLKVGNDLQVNNNMLGEFSQKHSGLRSLGQEITLYESMSSSYGKEHTITGWADARDMSYNSQGLANDLVIYRQFRRNEQGEKITLGTRWEPLIEQQIRMEMMDIKVSRMIWSKPGTARTNGDGELMKAPEGLYWKIRNNGNHFTYNRGEFSINMLRNIFGDLFYRRVAMKDRHVKLYSNEAGIEAFRQANKSDLLNSGLTIIADDRFIDGRGQKMVLNWAFDSVVTMETGKIEVIHLPQLDEPQTNSEFGQNKKSTPLYICFNVSPTSGGTMKGNIREVRQPGQPAATWAYIDGLRSHLGFQTQHNAANRFDGYTIVTKDRSDIFVEDLSCMVLIEENPQY